MKKFDNEKNKLTKWQLYEHRQFSGLYIIMVMLVALCYDNAYTGRSTSTTASDGAI